MFDFIKKFFGEGVVRIEFTTVENKNISVHIMNMKC